MTEERARMSSVLGATGLVLGNVQGQGDFEVRGRVQGDIVLDGRVLVAGGGLVLGTIEAIQILVSGTVRGDLIAEEGVEITGSGQVEGNVTSPRVAIESGAKVRGHLRTGDDSPVAVRGAPDLRPAAEAAPIPVAAPPVAAAAAPVAAAAAAVPDGAEQRAAGGKKRRRRRRGGDRPLSVDANGPPTDAAGTAATHVDEGRKDTPPARPTRPSGPMPRAEGAGQVPPSSDGRPPRKRGKALPTFVKGARGHLRG